MRPETGNKELEARINSRISDFDLLALMRLLQHEGFDPGCILFQSHRTESSIYSLIHEVILKENWAVISINIGLLSSQSPLPDYFFKNMESDSLDQEKFIYFIRFFDHIMILNYIKNVYPEISQEYFSNWEWTKRQYLELLNLKSISVQHWLFQLVYPEFKIVSKRGKSYQTVQSDSFELGGSRFSDGAVLGGKLRIPVSSTRIVIRYENEFIGICDKWIDLVNDRFYSRLYHLFVDKEIHLDITMTFPEWRKRLHLAEGAGLGYEFMQTGERLSLITSPPSLVALGARHEFKIFEGLVAGDRGRKPGSEVFYNQKATSCRLNI
ncbi:MAG: hypothetical protein GY839_11335 [candidate division Zixibacteria bacterium]|nr:hypothetical protein [candidate division Zixibacteria bacterium]